ncbi:FecR domain-containing protein [Mucilaginibacter sp. CSA2-8R]|uniref:FecR family protein n=1 Tax=Mucilaginibacter sp. CSA2-8R TaxID=3141542 RepID=UPI00315D7C7F
MNDTDKEVHQLLLKYRQGQCTPEEQQRLFHIYNLTAKSITADNAATDFKAAGDEIWQRLPHTVQSQSTTAKLRHLYMRPVFRWVAASLLLASAGIFMYKQQQPAARFTKVYKKRDLLPGKNAAMLRLSNGKEIFLSDFTGETIAEQNGVRIVKDKTGQLTYEIESSAENAKPGLNTLTTSNGQQYQVKLPDGTLVWLNAGSSLTFPTLFSKNSERVVSLVGEGYFEVATSKNFDGRKNPFIVQTDKQTVKVLGTHFNISSYANENIVKTTLLEGSIALATKTAIPEIALLKPGQQALMNSSNSRVSVKNLDDAEAEVAWKSGLFHFENTQIKEVMKQLARWYNVDVVYKGDIPDAHFTGEMYKSLSASKVLDGLAYTGLHFTIKDNQIIVTQ